MEKLCEHFKGRGHTVDQCFKLVGYPEWYNSIKGRKKGNTGFGSSGYKMVANAHVDYGDTPLDQASQSHTTVAGGLDSDMVALICQQVMRTMKSKHGTDVDSGGCGYSSFASFVGITSFSCSVFGQNDNTNWIIDSGATTTLKGKGNTQKSLQ